MSSLRIRSNMTSALAYRNLSKTQHSLQTTLERLSSGLRINKASDDTAGSAISTRMSNQLRGIKQANRNAQYTNNLIQTAEGGLSDISSILSRMRALAVQASTDTLTGTDRASVNLEFQALKDEISRISLSTEYNEMNVLDGTHQSEEGKGTWRLQIGADNDANSQIELQIMNASAKGLGLVKAQSNSTNGMLSQDPISSSPPMSSNNPVSWNSSTTTTVSSLQDLLQHGDFSGMDLSGITLQGAILYGANLQRANLQGAELLNNNLQGANLQDANLQGANLEGAMLQDANLQAVLDMANLQGAFLYGANLQGANLDGADLTNANLQGAQLHDAILIWC